MSIPKVIHYCWFGGHPKSELVQQCIESWKQFCPDYEIKEWNEDNFDIECIQYVRDAYADKKWAFVSDYARLKIVYENGGTYLDTDVLLKSRCLDEWTKYDLWLASDDIRYINTGLGFGACQHNLMVKAVMDEYEKYKYPNGTNVSRDTLVLEKELSNWSKSERTQVVNDALVVGCRDYGRYAQHLYAYTWSDDATQVKTTIPPEPSRWEQIKIDFKWELAQKLHSPGITAYMDARKGTVIERIYTFLCYDLLAYGPIYYFKRLFLKILKK